MGVRDQKIICLRKKSIFSTGIEQLLIGTTLGCTKPKERSLHLSTDLGKMDAAKNTERNKTKLTTITSFIRISQPSTNETP